MNEENLITYYNKFNEDKRLNTKHGNIEFITALNYINKYKTLLEHQNEQELDNNEVNNNGIKYKLK